MVEALKPIVGLYVRVSPAELARLRDEEGSLAAFDWASATEGGCVYDLGRGWEQLAVWLDGGVRLPEHGPTLGEVELPDTDEAGTWSSVEPARVVAYAESLAEQCRHFAKLYAQDGEDTDPFMSDGRTGGYRGNRDYLVKKLQGLAKHYADAAGRGEAMVVRIGARP